MRRICRVVLAANTCASGLRTDVVVRSYDGMWFPGVVAASGTLSPAFATGEIKFPSGTTKCSGFSTRT